MFTRKYLRVDAPPGIAVCDQDAPGENASTSLPIAVTSSSLTGAGRYPKHANLSRNNG
jgi:hypothetical protein